MGSQSQQKLAVWLINPYVNLPGEDWRLGRSSLLAYELARRNHEVILWTGNISHRSKTVRALDWEDRVVEPRFTIRLVPSTHYTKNISVARLKYEAKFAQRTFARAKREVPPDIIVAHDPPQVCGHCGYLLSKKFQKPLITDTVDLWPELWQRVLPKWLGPLGSIVFSPFYLWRRRNWGHASGFTTLATPYLDLVHREVDPHRQRPSCVAFNGIDVGEFRSQMEGSPTVEFSAKATGTFRIVFAGTLGPSYDIDAMITAAKFAQEASVPVEFCLAGDGPLREKVEEAAKGSLSLKYIGKLAPSDLAKFYATCDCGICGYGVASNVEMPDKFYDYLAAGLSVVNSLNGEVAAYVKEHRVGLQYQAGSGESLFEAIRELISNPTLQNEFKTNSFALGMEFDNSVQIAKYADLVEKVAKG